jgi:hypothetical protein
MSFPRPPQLTQFVRVPPAVRRLQGHARGLAPAGILGLVAGGLGGYAYGKHWSDLPNPTRVAVAIAVVACVGGGVLALFKRSEGAPIAGGGAALFMLQASSLIGTEISFGRAFGTLESKLLAGAAVAGLIVAILAIVGAAGRSNPAIGVLIAILGFVPPVALGIISHLDDQQLALQVAPVVGSVIVAILGACAALRGRYGVLLPLAGAGTRLPSWIDSVRTLDDREAAAYAATFALAVIVVLAVIGQMLAARVDQDGVTGGGYTGTNVSPTSGQSEWPPAQAMPAGDPLLTPNVAPPIVPTAATRRVASPVPSVGAPAAPQVAALGRWAPDPYGRHQVRYWNGTRWTDNVSDNGVTALDPVPQ